MARWPPRAHEDLPDRQAPLDEPSLHRRCPGLPPKPQRSWRPDRHLIAEATAGIQGELSIEYIPHPKTTPQPTAPSA